MNGRGALDARLLSIIVFLPLLGAFGGAGCLPCRRGRSGGQLLDQPGHVLHFALSVCGRGSSRGPPRFQFEERAAGSGLRDQLPRSAWTGWRLRLILAHDLLSAISIVASFHRHRDRSCASYNCVSCWSWRPAMLGVFVSLDLFLLHVLGSDAHPDVLPDRDLGRRAPHLRRGEVLPLHDGGLLLMLVAILYLRIAHKSQTGQPAPFDLARALRTGLARATQESGSSWRSRSRSRSRCRCSRCTPGLPDAHVEAPTAGSVILAGVMLKMGTFGFLRFALPLVPGGDPAPRCRCIALLVVIGIIYGALVAMVQPDMKKLVAYSSVSHLGFVMLGTLRAEHRRGVQGGILQMVNHGVSTGALFLLVGVDLRAPPHADDRRLRRA